MDQGNTGVSTITQERVDGNLTGDLDVLALGMTDDDIARAVGNRVQQAESFWNSKLNLDAVREKNEKYWVNNYYGKDDLFDYQEEYKDPRIFTAIETLVSLVTSKPPQPIVTQAYDTEASYELAQQIQQALLAKYEDMYMKSKFQMVARHLLVGYRMAVMKVRWDNTVGDLQEDGSRFGDFDVSVVRPQRIVLDAGAQEKQDIPLIGEYRSEMLEDLCETYKEKEEEIFAECGKSYGTAIDMTKRVGYMEIHFTTRDKQTRKKIEAIVWKFKNVVLHSTKTPLWNYDETYTDERGVLHKANFLEKPAKPYIIYNYLNLGKWVIDDISLTDLAGPLQEIADKRGRQIVENADQMNGGWVFNTKMVKAEDASAWINNPGDKILATGNVNEAVARLSAPQLDPMVVEDKQDARNEIDNVYGTHGAIKGEVTNSKTLGQDVMSQRGDSARLNTLATAIEDGADYTYKWEAQMMKVFYDTPQLIRYNPDEDTTLFFSLGRDQIEDRVAIKVKTGSVLPEDPAAKKNDAKEMAPLLDPLNLAKGLNVPNPKQWAKENFYYRVMPDRYMTEILGITPEAGAQDPSALQHIQMLNAGQNVPPEAHPTKEHLATHQAFIDAPPFQQLPPEIQAIHTQHIKAELANAKAAMGIQERPGLPAETGQPADPGTPPALPAGGGQPQLPPGAPPANPSSPGSAIIQSSQQ